MRRKLQLVTTVALSLDTFLAGQPRHLSNSFDVTLISSDGGRLAGVGLREGVPTHGVEMTRSISPLADLAAVWRLFRWFRRTKPDLVQSYTPKAGLVVMVAAAMAGVPVRVHGVVGMPLMETLGIRRALLTYAERATYSFCTHLTCNSRGLAAWMSENVSDSREITVLGSGSINGVDVDRYLPAETSSRRAARERLGIRSTSVVLLFVGRLVRDKGVEELLAAFDRLRSTGRDVVLLLAGSEEPDRDPLPHSVIRQLRASEGIVQVGWADDVRPYYAAADVFVLPSYREGLPTSLLEASACGLACVATDINGCNEVIVPGQTGLLVPPKDADALALALETTLTPAYRQALGRAARQRVIEHYDQRALWDEIVDFYHRLLIEAGRPSSVAG